MPNSTVNQKRITVAVENFKQITVSGLTNHVTGAANVGAGSGFYKEQSGTTLVFKSLTAGAGVTLTPSGNEIEIASSLTGDFVTTPTFTGYTASTDTTLSSLRSDIDTVSGISVNNTSNITTISGLSASNLVKINALSGDVVQNTSNITTVSGTSAQNVLDIASNLVKINSLSGDVTQNNSDILSLSGDVSTNTSNIATVSGLSASNLVKINALSGDVTTNTLNIAIVSGLSASNLVKINSLSGDVTTNTLNIATVSGDVIQNSSDILSLSGDVNQNTSDILSLSGDVATKADINASIVSVTAATTGDTSWDGKIIEANGTFTVTVPTGLDTGFQFVVVNVGSGTITLASNGTLNSKDSATDLANQWGAATVYHRGSDVHVAFGDLS
jgi:hypothetical protein